MATNPVECIRCYSYQGECFEECPLETLIDDKNYLCIEKQLSK